jgi:hypothetical protein
MIEADQHRTFEAFARRLSAWWPGDTGRRRPADVRIEERIGRIYQLGADGVEREWGRLTSWRPPHSFSFVPGAGDAPEDTEIALHFQRLGPALTRVVVEHRGWERMSSALYDRHTVAVGGWLAALRSYASLFETETPRAASVRPAADMPTSD